MDDAIKKHGCNCESCCLDILVERRENEKNVKDAKEYLHTLEELE